MKKVRLFVCRDMTVIDMGLDVYRNFHSYDFQEVIANVTDIQLHTLNFDDGTQYRYYEIATDYKNPYHSVCSKFSLSEELYNTVNWVE